MAGGVGGERRREGGESSSRKVNTLYRPGNLSLTWLASWTTHLLMATTGLGYLALAWSTVVLLGGFVTALQRKDFWCLTFISLIQAARINELGNKLVLKLFGLLIGLHRRCVSMARERIAFQTVDQKPILGTKAYPSWLRILIIVGTVITVYLPLLPVLAASYYIVVFPYGSGGPTVCIGLALWRIVRHDYGSNDDGDGTKANLAPALDMFYGLILCQGVLYMVWFVCHLPVGALLIAKYRQDYELPRDWGQIWLLDYYLDTIATCWMDSASIQGRTISRYAVDLVDSESWDDNLSGARMLAMFIRQGADMRLLLLLSRPRVQKLIDILGCGVLGVSSEMRKAAAIIVAHLAGDIHLSQFPGAIRCISTLLQDEAATTQTYRCKSNQENGRPQLHRGAGAPRSTMHALVRVFEKMLAKSSQEVRRQGEGDGDDAVQQKNDVGQTIGSCNEMILQGLTILERLASDHHNCMEICTSPGLLPRIMAPLCSSTLIQGVKQSTAWADVVNGSLKVLYRLMRCPGHTGTSLRREIFANQQAISNLESFLGQSNEACHQDQELQMRAMEILTELALDVSINLTKKMKQSLMKKQLEIFLDKESAIISKQLRATAGRTLTSLSVNSKEVCSAIVRDHFDRLTEILDATNNITYRIIAAQILGNICAHCDLGKDCVKDALLPKVLEGILSTKRDHPQGDEDNKRISTSVVDDEENQNKCAPSGNDDENLDVSAHGDKAERQEISDQNDSSDEGHDDQIATNELLESLLSLTLVIYDKLISTNDFDDAVQKQGQGGAEFVLKLKTIVEDNCKETPISLRIVNLCGQIAASMMCRNQYTAQFKIQGFVESLSKAKEIMSNLESCVFFGGTEFGKKMISMPFLSELEEKVKDLAGEDQIW